MMKKISTLTGIIIIVAAAVLLFGGAFGYQWYENSKLPARNAMQSVAGGQTTNYKQIQNSNTETADWKTYKNNEYGYEIKYPMNWTFRQYPDINGGITGGAGFRPSNKPDINSDFITIDSYSYGENDCNIPFSEYVKTAYAKEVGNGDQTLNSIEKIENVNGVETYKTTWKYTALNGKKGITLPITYFGNSVNNCESTKLALANSGYLDIYNEMIKTFKFTNYKQTQNSNNQNQNDNYSFRVEQFSVSVISNGEVTQSLLPPNKDSFAFIANDPNWKKAIIISNQDINFDRYKDVAIATNTGYAGVNFFYDYYVFNPSTRQFEKLLSNICNPNFRSLEKTISSSCKSGPSYESTIYTFNGKTYDAGQTIDEFTKQPINN